MKQLPPCRYESYTETPTLDNPDFRTQFELLDEVGAEPFQAWYVVAYPTSHTVMASTRQRRKPRCFEAPSRASESLFLVLGDR